LKTFNTLLSPEAEHNLVWRQRTLTQVSADSFFDWFTKKTTYLTDQDFKILDVLRELAKATQEGYHTDAFVNNQSDKALSIVEEAQGEIQQYKTDLSNFNLSSGLEEIRNRCSRLLDEWETCFNLRHEWANSLKKGYTEKSVELWSKANDHSAIANEETGEIILLFDPLLTEIRTKESQQVIKEKEIIREIVKIRCPYRGKLYNETDNTCPHCGASR